MPESETQTRTPAASALRIVLFGMPAAGKTSLLAALAQAAQLQEQVLHGRLIDHGQGLADLKRQLYGDRTRDTLEEVVPYHVAFEPTANSGGAAADRLEATLIDCDGRAANEILSRLHGPDDLPGGRPLAQAILAADTLILVVDASAEPGLLQKDFNQFARFLRLFEQGRGRRSEVAGLPVYLVLTKCDLLAKKEDTAAAWMQRIEERKRKVGEKFQEHLAKGAGREGLAFGKVDLHLWATAIGRPELADRPAKPHEPYGVAELFRQCFASAKAFHERHSQAVRRLRYTVAGVVGFVTILALLAAGFFLTRPSAEVLHLENELRGVIPAVGSDSADRFREAAAKLKTLTKVLKNPAFDQLPPEKQDEAGRLAKELEAYLAYRKVLLEKVQDPQFASTAEELDRIEKNLNALPLPATYATAWVETDVARLRKQWLNDVGKFREAAPEAEVWYRQQTKAGKNLATEGGLLIAMSIAAKTTKADWLVLVKEFQAQKPPYPDDAKVPGAFQVTWGRVYQFRPVLRARQELDEVKKNLEKIRGIIAHPL
jgi:GTPase SAR1 family protein